MREIGQFDCSLQRIAAKIDPNGGHCTGRLMAVQEVEFDEESGHWQLKQPSNVLPSPSTIWSISSNDEDFKVAEVPEDTQSAASSSTAATVQVADVLPPITTTAENWNEEGCVSLLLRERSRVTNGAAIVDKGSAIGMGGD